VDAGASRAVGIQFKIPGACVRIEAAALPPANVAFDEFLAQAKISGAHQSEMSKAKSCGFNPVWMAMSETPEEVAGPAPA
jgi:hypothetical protein